MKGFKRKQFRTKRLVLRPYRASDYKTWFDFYVNRQKQRSKYDRAPMPAKDCTRAEFEKICRRHERNSRHDRVYVYGGFEIRTGRMVGIVDIGLIRRDIYQMANLGYQVHNQVWGRGYGKELAIAGSKIAFTHLHLNRVEAAINVDNKRSLALARSIKMHSEGLRKRYLFEDGKWTDNYVFTFTPEDFGLKGRPQK